MKPVAINFTWQPDRRAERVGFLLLALALPLALWVGWEDAELHADLESRQSELQRLQRAPDKIRTTLSPETKERQRNELKVAQGVIDRLDTPWGVLFAAVDSAFDDQVTLLNVEPEPERREIRLTAEAKDMQAMLAYVRQIGQSPVFREAYLASHQINQQDPLRPVRFIVNARWVVPPAVVSDMPKASNDPEQAGDAGSTVHPPVAEQALSPAPVALPDAGVVKKVSE